MAADEFPPSPAIKRKPLSARFHARNARSSGTEEDVFPLVSLQGSSAETHSLNPDRASTNYESAPLQHTHPTFDSSRGFGHHLFTAGGRYSKLPTQTGAESNYTSPHKGPAIVHGPSPVEPEPSTPLHWNPTWLSSSILSCFVLLWLLLLVGLLILWHFATAQNGISTTITNNHYAWTYGPTALFVVIGLALTRVDYSCRILAPWRHLRNGHAHARSSLLLDYVSPILLRTLVSASTNGDWAVLASSLSTLILRIVIVFSTGLLVLTPTIVSRPINDARLGSKFAGTDYATETEVRTDELMRYYGIHKRGMSHQYGTTDTVAYERLDPTSVTSNATVTATVNGIFPYFDCETAQPQIVRFAWDNDGYYPFADKLKINATMSSTKCPGALISVPSICSPTTEECSLGRSIISDSAWYSGYDLFNPNVDLGHFDELDPCNNLFQLGIFEMDYQRIDGPPVNTSAAWNVTLTETVGIICTVGYTVDLVNATINMMDLDSPGSVNVSGSLGRVMGFLPGHSRGNFTDNLTKQTYTFTLNPPPDGPRVYDFAKILASIAGDSARALLNVDTLKEVAERVGKGVGVLIADHYLRQPDSRVIQATERLQESRLIARPLSVWVMSAGFVILALLAISIRVWRPRDVLSRNPSAIATSAAILAASPSLQNVLRGTGPLSDHQLETALTSVTASSRAAGKGEGRTFSVEVVSSNEGLLATRASSSDSITWWRPMSTRMWFMITATSLPAALIMVLEILQHKSDAHDGLVDVSPTSAVERSLPLILASTLLISIAIMYDAIHFAATTLVPYQALVRGSAASRHSISCGLSGGNMSLWSKLEALLPQFSIASLATIATVLGSFLTIVGSGLYTIENVQVSSQVTVASMDSFVRTFDISTDGDAGAMFNLIQHNNASYPALTYDGLAFPSIDIASLGSDAQEQLQGSGTVTFRGKFPAMRASLNCTFVPRDIMATSLYYYKTSTCPDTVVSFNASIPASCPRFLNVDNQTATNIPLGYSAQFDCLHPGSLPAARGAVLRADYTTSQGTTLGAPINPPDCPSLAFIFGYWLVNSTSTANITSMTCVQGLEEVQAEVTFEASQTGVQVKKPPVIDETTRRWLQAFNSTYWFTQFGYFQGFNDSGTSPDYFYSNIFNGPDGVPPDELVGPANADRFANVTQHMYRRYMAQLISSTMRQNLSATDTASRRTFLATVSDASVMRVKQNAASKLVLQIFLGVMLACGILVYMLRDMRHVLPHSPWSIAGSMSLLTGAKMVERKTIPAGAEFMNDKELAKVFDGYVFSLGWWNTGVGTGYIGQHPSARFGIDVGQPDTSTRRRRAFWS